MEHSKEQGRGDTMTLLARTRTPRHGEAVSSAEPRVRWVLAALMLGMLLAALDSTIVSTAMPRIVAELGGLTYYSWVFSAYMLTSTVCVPIFGKFSDLYGRRRMYQLGLALFVTGSALCGFASTMMELILFRALQGVGAAALMPVALTIIGDLFPPDQRGKVQGLFGSVFGIASIAGPAIGGILTDHFSWPWVFWVNLPLGVAAMVVIAYGLPETKGGRNQPVDYLGAVLLMGGLSALLLALVMGGTEWPWGSVQIVSLFVASAVLLAFFGYVETKAADPLLPLSLLGNRVIGVSLALGFLVGAAMFGAISYIPLFVQGVIGVSASLAGYVLTPLMLATIVSSIVSGRLVTKVTYRGFAVFSSVVIAAGFLLLATMGVETPLWVAMMYMILVGLGMGPLNPVLTIAVQNATDATQRGLATSSLQLFRSVGGTVGVTVMGVFLNHQLEAQLQRLASHVPPGMADQVGHVTSPQALLSPEVRAALPVDLLKLLQDALAHALDRVFLLSALITAFVFAVGLLYGRAKAVGQAALRRR
ncbi:MDR family MFS transporter [Calditerricola yamamurae]